MTTPVSVYIVRNKKNDHKYVGISKKPLKRFNEHWADVNRGSDTRFHRALRKHGRDNFEWRIFAELPTPEEAQIAERLLIATLKPEYNLTAGGEGGWGYRHTPESLRKMSQSQKGKILTPEHIANIKASHVGMLGRKHTEETKAKIGAAHKGRGVGRKLSVETRAKMSASHTGKKRSAEQRARMSAAQQARRANGD